MVNFGLITAVQPLCGDSMLQQMKIQRKPNAGLLTNYQCAKMHNIRQIKNKGDML